MARSPDSRSILNPIEKPVFPLGAIEFAAALKTGHGRAVQQIEAHGAAGLEQEIVKACVSCLTYDPQCEAERAPWLCSIVERASLNETVVQAIETVMQQHPTENHRDMAQRSAILKELAAAGSDDARRLLYSTLARLPHTSDVIGAEQIIELDGVNGLMRVARQLGRWLQADPDFWVDDWLIGLSDESTGVVGGLAALEREAEVDSDVARYLAGIRKTGESQSAAPSRVDPTAHTGDQIVAYVNANPKEQCHWFRRWGAHASEDQREVVFDALLASDNPEHVKRLFRCFGKTGIPRFDHRLTRWIVHPDEQVRWAAVRGVAANHHPELRAAAMRLMAEGDTPNGVALLVNNFETGDFVRCADHLTRLDDADETHHLVGELLNLCQAHPGMEALDCLLYVYERSPCSNCRGEAVKALMNTNTAPAWVMAESAFDADPDTRALVSPEQEAL